MLLGRHRRHGVLIALKEDLIGLMMIQAPGQRDYWQLLRFLLHGVLA